MIKGLKDVQQQQQQQQQQEQQPEAFNLSDTRA
jgi:hypothetical protein